MRILHTSDWHLGRSLFEFSLLEDQGAILQQIYQIVRQHRVDVVVIAGDLYDRSMPSAEAVSLLDRAFSTLVGELGVQVVAVSGNHDSGRRVSYGSRLLARSGLFLEGELHPRLEPVTLADQHGPVHFYLLPYFIPQQVRLALEDRSIDSFSRAFAAILGQTLPTMDLSHRNVLVAHGFFLRLGEEGEGTPTCCDSELSVGTSELTDLSPAACFDYVALGHLHSPQSAGGSHLRYSGSPLQYSLSEAGRGKSVTLVELGEKGQLAVSQIPLVPRREVRVITGTMEELLDKTGQEPGSLEDYVFACIRSNGPVLGAMSQLRSLYPNALGLRFLREEAPLSPLTSAPQAAGLPMDRLFSAFYREVTGEEPSRQQTALLHRMAQDIQSPWKEEGSCDR